jgi:hypothetical protein
MSIDHLDGPLNLSFAVGCGLIAAGLAAAFTRSRVLAAAAGVVTTAAAAATLDPALTPAAAGLAALPIALVLTAGCRLWATVWAVACRPAVGGGLLIAAGVGLMIGSQAWYDAEVARAEQADLESLMVSDFWDGAKVAVADTGVTTDRGTPVPLSAAAERRTSLQLEQSEDLLMRKRALSDNLIRRGPADDASNCHGWVFTGGRYWLTAAAVETILAENGYAPPGAPAAGDLVVYRDEAGQPGHTAVVRAIADDGTVLVEGKWGAMGVYLHDVNAGYGKNITYYRSRRVGHLLRGLDAVPTPTAPSTAAAAAPAGRP